jgi:glyoxylase-like metal-dependent hydrolase (beta-lactamase superfamily II)
MRKILVVTGGLLALTLLLLTGVDRVCAADKLTQIVENVYAYVDTKNASTKNSFGANAGVIIGKDGILVVDTMVSAKEAKRFIKDIRAISRKPIKYVVNTHYHLDHSLGNSEFARVGAVIIAQENAGKAIENTAGETLKNVKEYGLTPKDMAGTSVVYPVLAYDNRMTIDIGGQRIEFIHARHCHTDGDTLVYLPDKKVLFAGDVLFTNYHPFLGEGNIEEWIKELDDIKSMDIEKIIPGHGPISGKNDLDDMMKYLLMFDAKAKELTSRSDDLQKIVAEIQNGLPRRSEGAWLISSNIQMKYLKKQGADILHPAADEEFGGFGMIVAQLFDRDSPQNMGGIVVLHVLQESEAGKAGIRTGDVITEIDGKQTAGRQFGDVVLNGLRAKRIILGIIAARVLM